MATSQFEATDARRCIPCFDEPALKATFRATLVVPSKLTALSNMPIVSSEDRGDGLCAPAPGRCPRRRGRGSTALPPHPTPPQDRPRVRHHAAHVDVPPGLRGGRAGVRQRQDQGRGGRQRVRDAGAVSCTRHTPPVHDALVPRLRRPGQEGPVRVRAAHGGEDAGVLQRVLWCYLPAAQGRPCRHPRLCGRRNGELGPQCVAAGPACSWTRAHSPHALPPHSHLPRDGTAGDGGPHVGGGQAARGLRGGPRAGAPVVRQPGHLQVVGRPGEQPHQLAAPAPAPMPTRQPPPRSGSTRALPPSSAGWRWTRSTRSGRCGSSS